MSAVNLEIALEYTASIVRARLDVHFARQESVSVTPPEFVPDEGFLFRFLSGRKVRDVEFIALMLALAPHLDPGFFTRIMAEYLPDGGDLPAFGGAKGQQHRGILPTGETVLFVLAGASLQERLPLMQLFNSDHWLARERILSLETVREGEPPLSGRLLLEPEWVEMVLTEQLTPPRFSTQFPAEALATNLSWDDLVLPPETLNQIHEIEAWVKHADTFLYSWKMADKFKPGYRALFHGPPGTGKTFAASLLGKYTGRPVYRVDLSMVVSKYIGETEKNLATLFDKARDKQWILFFDEADALFGKRTGVRDAHDKYANQEVSYLLQRVETYPGLAILASNLKSNIDEAFIRRFNAIIHFPLPSPAERAQIWRKAFPPEVELAPEIQFDSLGARHELTGSHIMNIVQYSCFSLLDRGQRRLSLADLEKAIRREFQKEGKLV